jgi:transposase
MNELNTLSKQTLIEQVKLLQKSSELLQQRNELLQGKSESFQKESELLQKKSELLQKSSDELKQEVNWYAHQLAQLRRLMFGAKRERFIPTKDQMTLPFEVKPVPEVEPTKETISYKRKKSNRENHPGRNALPSHLRVEEIVIEPDNLPEGSKKIGEEISYELEYIPCRLYIKKTVRPKYSLVKEEGVTIAQLPSRPIEKCIAGSGLLAQIMADKFVDHLPIYRQIERYKRLDVKLSSSTINSWQESVCRLFSPLYNELKRQVLLEGYHQVDETPIKVLDKQKKGKTHQRYHWVYHSPIRKAVIGVATFIRTQKVRPILTVIN